MMTSYYYDDLCGLGEMAAVARQLWRTSGLSPADIQTAVLYDHFTPYVLYQLEELGFCAKGEAKDFVRDGNIEIGGGLPVNTHGGQLGEAYLHGMNGIAEGVRQVRGTSVQPGARRGARTGDRRDRCSHQRADPRRGRLTRDERRSDRERQRRLVVPPLPEQLGELPTDLRCQVVRVEGAGGPDGGPHLLEVVRAVRTVAQMGFEPPPVRPRQVLLQVVADQLHHLLADELVSPS